MADQKVLDDLQFLVYELNDEIDAFLSDMEEACRAAVAEVSDEALRDVVKKMGRAIEIAKAKEAIGA